MAFDGQQSNDLRATVALSEEEARTGTTRTLTLPEGRQVTVSIPAGIRSGQEIRIEGQGQLSPYSGTRGALILTMSIVAADYTNYNNNQGGTDFPTAFIAAPPPPPQYTAGQYGGGNAYANPPSGEQKPMYLGQSAPDYTAPTYAQPPYTQPAQYTQPGQYLPPPPPAQQQKPRRRLSTGMTILLVVLAVLLIGGGGAIFYAAVYQPNKQHADATATAQTTVDARASSTAQALATSQAQTNATGTAVGQVTAQASATIGAYQSIYTQATSGNPALNDPLSSQNVNNWDVSSNCVFTNGAYHVIESEKGFFFYCIAQTTSFSNFAYQVNMQFAKGSSGGLIFRADSANSKFYFFQLDSDGSYYLYVYVDRTGGHAKTLLNGSSSIISNASNVVTVVARGSDIYLYVNKQYIASITDSTLSSGQIGLAANYVTNAADIAYTQAEVWRL